MIKPSNERAAKEYSIGHNGNYVYIDGGDESFKVFMSEHTGDFSVVYQNAYYDQKSFDIDAKNARNYFGEFWQNVLEKFGEEARTHYEDNETGAALVEVSQHDLGLVIEWFHVALDMNPEYLEEKDFQALANFYKKLDKWGNKPPTSYYRELNKLRERKKQTKN